MYILYPQITSVLGVSEPAEVTFLPAIKSAIKGIASDSGKVTITTFNRMYVRAGFSVRPSFASYLSNFFNSSVTSFTSGRQAAKEINAAVAAITRNHIKNVVTPDALSGDSVLAFVSAMYFKGSWKHPFNSLKRSAFLTQAGEKQVVMMRLHGVQLQFATTPRYDAVALPYTDEDYFMLLIRPRDRSMSAALSLKNSLDTLTIDRIVQQLAPTNVGVIMPRFKIEADYALNDAVSRLGIRRIFSLGADFSGVTQDNGELAISAILHKVFIDVNERGTEAGGVAAGFAFRSRPVVFTADRPFLAVVYNKRYRVNMFTAFVGDPPKA